MNTTFLLRLLEMDEVSARGLAKECFYQIDLLEGQLSRFMEGSEVSRINEMAAGETLYLSESCHRCLLLAIEAAVQTHGLFDITLGARIEHRKSGAAGTSPDLRGKLMIHPDVPAITCEEPGRVIDLGGIGKGFALDQVREWLIDWEVEGAMVSAGASSLMAYGAHAWPVDLSGDQDSSRVALREQSLSASGVGIQGSHIVHPWGEEAMPEQPSRRVWVMADTAALAEVWSTALMLVDAEQVPELIAGVDGVTRVYADRDGRVVSLP